MEKIDADLLIENASELLTLAGGQRIGKEQLNDLKIIKNGAVAVKNGKIAAVGETSELAKYVKAKKKIDASGKVVLPGLIDSHTHVLYAGTRENEFVMKLQGVPYLEILKNGGGILRTVRDTRKASETELVDITKKRLDKMLQNGTTTIEIKSGYGLSTKDELKMLNAIKSLQKNYKNMDVVPTFLGAHATPPEHSADSYVDLVVNDMLPKVAGLAEFADVFCEKDVFSIEQSRRILNEAKKYGMKLKIHADEMYDTGSAALAAEVGATSADHLLHASDDGIKRMAEKHVTATLLPAVPIYMVSDLYAPAKKMIEAGVPVAIATDSCPNCPIESMQLAMQLASLKMRMTPAEVISASTINAAYAIGKEEKIGSLEIGKQADILIMDAPNHGFIPYQLGANYVEKVIKKGKVVVDRK